SGATSGITTTVNVASGVSATCTITNTRKPTLTVTKVLSPSNDTGKFNLGIDGAIPVTGANVGNGGSTGAQVVSIGGHVVSETAGTSTSLADYDSSINCTNGTTIGTGTSLNVNLVAGDNVTCTI